MADTDDKSVEGDVGQEQIPSTGSSPDPSPEPERRRRRFPIKSAIAIVLIVLVALPVVSTLQPNYYERYPEIGPRMQNWRTSTHARVGCDECHIEPGVTGYATFIAKSIPDFYSQLVTGADTSNLLGIPGTPACQKCHTGFRDVSSSGDLLIPHQAHVEILEIECSLCHQDLVHAEAEKGRNTPPMTMCLDACHDGEAASNECIDCHTQKQVPDDHLQANWLEIHAEQQDVVDCGECHAWSPTDFCADCHAELPPSHEESPNWKKDHQYPALERGDDPCKTCHDEEFCQQCHD